jgi:thiol-disulfide isomerase/thioredoxin
MNVAPQSGRRIATPRTLPAAPIQPPLNPEPEPPARAAAPLTALLYLPEGVRERRIRTLDNNSFRLADFHGKIIVINLWATWCGPCRREIPEYERVRKSYLERDIEFIALTTEDPGSSSEKVNRFVRSVSFGFRLGWADRELARTLTNGRNSIPQTIVVDADGRILSHWIGYSPGQLKEMIETALAQATP